MTSTDTSEDSECRFPRRPRGSVRRRSSASRSGTGSGAAPAGKWRLMQSASHDEATGAVLSVTV